MEAVDVMIHVDEDLEQEQQESLESELRTVGGVIAPRFNKPHLLMIAYNSDETNMLTLLNQVKSHGYHAQLVGL